MFEIPKEVLKDVYLLVDNLMSYENEDNLSWMQVYKGLLRKLEIDNSNLLLSSVVKELTSRGYDIIDDPFKLEKFK